MPLQQSGLPARHAVLHAPQLLVLLLVSVHFLSQQLWPAAQESPQVLQFCVVPSIVQTPLQQSWLPAGHALPQELQLLTSLCMFTQVPLQLVKSALQLTRMQLPFAQPAVPLGKLHTWSQKPQLLTSLPRSLQMLLQQVWLAVQETPFGLQFCVVPSGRLARARAGSRLVRVAPVRAPTINCSALRREVVLASALMNSSKWEASIACSPS